MFAVRYFSSTHISEHTLAVSETQLSLVAYCAGPLAIEGLLDWQRGWGDEFKQVELIACVEPLVSDLNGSLTEQDLEPLKAAGWVVLFSKIPSGLPALRLDEGICSAHGRIIWLINTMAGLPSISPSVMLRTAKKQDDQSVSILLNAKEIQQLPDLPGIKLPIIDILYKGWQFPIGHILFPKAIFRSLGLLDPHIAMQDLYVQEFCLRICRWCKVDLIAQNEGATGLNYGQFPAYLYKWLDIDRTEKLSAEGIFNYQIDDLEQYNSQISKEIRWDIYLNKILPYYWSFRAYLPAGFLEAPQSLPPLHQHITVLKTDYETLVDVGLRNFDQFSQGHRFYKLNYIQYHQFDPSRQIDDGLLLPRPADPYYVKLIQDCAAQAKPAGFVLDDDLLHFYELGGGFSAFRPGHSAYDAMVNAIKAADVVLCGGNHIRETVQPHNPRTVHYEGCVLPRFLKSTGTPRTKVFKFGYAGGGYRMPEMQMLWPAIEQICKEFKSDVQFEFWGMDRSSFSNVPEHVSFRPFTTNYYSYLDALSKAGFNAMLVPHLLMPSPQKGKLPNKVYEAAVAGAFGIFSDVPTYEVVKKFGIGLSVEENTESWYSAMKTALEMSGEDYSQLQASALQFVREFYSAPAMLPVHEAGLHALFFHGATRPWRGENGKPVVMYVFPVISGTGGGEVVFRRRLELAKKAGIQPLVVIPQWLKDTADWPRYQEFLASLDIPCDFAWFRAFVLTPLKDDVLPLEQEEVSVRALFDRHNVALVHSGGYIPVFGKICSDLGIPHVLTHYGVDDNYWWPMEKLPFQQCDLVQSDTVRYAKKWGKLFNSEWVVARDTCPESFFELGFKRLYQQYRPERNQNSPTHLGVMGALFPRKCQLEIIQAVTTLLEKGANITLTLFGSLSADPEYSQRCIQEAKKTRFADRIQFTDHVTDIYSAYQKTDIILTLSTFESLPTVIKEGMPAGCLVVASLAGGIGEICKDNQNSIISKGSQPDQIAEAIQRALDLSPEQSLTIRRNAYSMAIQEFHPRRGLADLLLIYNQALAIHNRQNPAGDARRNAQMPLQAALPAVSGPLIEAPKAPSRRVTDLGGGLTYEIVPHHDRWYGLDIMVGTHGGPTGGALELKILSKAGNLLRRVNLPLENIYDNDWIQFRFEPIQNSREMIFILKLQPLNPPPAMRISLYENAPRELLAKRAIRKYARFVSLKLASQNLYCRLYYEAA